MGRTNNSNTLILTAPIAVHSIQSYDEADADAVHLANPCFSEGTLSAGRLSKAFLGMAVMGIGERLETTARVWTA